ncbi:MAG TPA: chromosomal replication initiator protein DnaA [Spirochaetia bacterium]|nr:chromosomal replication initiator protein DnaA [Spirochaetia bacterium]
MSRNESEVIWNGVTNTLKKKLDKHSYETWVKYVKLVDFIDNTLFIEVPNDFSRAWLSNNYSTLINETLNTLTRRDISVKFVMAGEVPKALARKRSAARNTIENAFIPLNSKYTFDSFVVGNGNRFAHAASLAVAESPAKAYNPLFIYGGVGLGKTHLMHAIGHCVVNREGQHTRVAYVTSETFTNEIIYSIREDTTVEFRNKYRSMDILLVDDIQFVAGKERTQEEFFHTFNTLYEANKQIVISSDRPPKEIPTLEDRLRSRFEWGLIADIQPPDLETRIAILQKKAQLENMMVPDETILFIANQFQSNIRELEGALNTVNAYAELENHEIMPDEAAIVLKDILPPAKPKVVTAALVVETVSAFYNLRQEEFKAKKRTRAVAFPRQIAMYLTRELTDLSLPQIGNFFGGRDHTTVIHAYEKISTEMKEDQTLKTAIEELTSRLKS